MPMLIITSVLYKGKMTQQALWHRTIK